MEKISQRELERLYNSLLYEVKTKEFYTEVDLSDRTNIYHCGCRHQTITKDVDAGVTPFTHTCEKCGGMAKSSFYSSKGTGQVATQEWYRPTLKECLKLRKKPELLNHVLQGGLLNRKIA